jgi:hypothetical protein
MYTGCISISTIRELSPNVIDKNSINENEFKVYFAKNQKDLCVSENQLQTIKNGLRRNLIIPKNAEVDVLVYQEAGASFPLGFANFLISAVTYTIIPMFANNSFHIEVSVRDKDKIEVYRASSYDEGLITLFALPFAYSRQITKVRRQNIAEAFDRLKNEPSKRLDVLERAPEPAKPCSNFIMSSSRSTGW